MSMRLGHSFKRITSWLDTYQLIFPSSFLLEDNQVEVEVTGSRKLENGLVISGTFKARTRSHRMGAKFLEELTKVKGPCTHMDISLEEMKRKPARL